METRPLLLVMSLVACSLSDAAPLAPQVQLPCSCLFLFSFPVTSPSQSSFDVCQPSTHTHTYTHIHYNVEIGSPYIVDDITRKEGDVVRQELSWVVTLNEKLAHGPPLFSLSISLLMTNQKSISILPVLSCLSVFQLIISKKVFVCNAKKGR